MPVRGVIFDLDGTLIDSRLDFEAIRRDMRLPPHRPILEVLDEMDEGPAKDECLAILRTHEMRGAQHATLMPGVKEFLDWLARRGIPRAVITRNSRESTELVTRRLGLDLSPVITRNDAPAKPDPRGILDICKSWAVEPGEVVLFGDYVFDIQAGQAAGVATVLYAPDEPPGYAYLSDFVIRNFAEAADVVRSLDER